MPGQGWLKGGYRYLAALIFVGLGLVARWLLQPLFDGSFMFSTFYPVIVVTAYFAGAGPAIMAAVLSAALALWPLWPPAFGLIVTDKSLTSLGFFTVTSAVDIYFITGMTRALSEFRLERARAEVLAEGHANLFREFNERATNHLQLVAALLQKQAREDQSGALAEAAKRTLMISRIHRSLHGDPEQTTDFAAFARQMLDGSLRATGRHVEVEVEDHAIRLPSDQAASLAVVLFESFRAMLRRQVRPGRGLVSISLSDAGEDYRLRLSSRTAELGGSPLFDDLGPQIVSAVTEQLQGRFSAFSTADGVVYEFAFPKTPQPEGVEALAWENHGAPIVLH